MEKKKKPEGLHKFSKKSKIFDKNSKFRQEKQKKSNRLNFVSIKAQKWKQKQPMYPGRAPVDKKKLLYHSRGDGLEGSGIKTNYKKKKLQNREKKIEYSVEQAARAELLLPEESG